MQLSAQQQIRFFDKSSIERINSPDRLWSVCCMCALLCYYHHQSLVFTALATDQLKLIMNEIEVGKKRIDVR